jgi:hypothetical protein
MVRCEDRCVKRGSGKEYLKQPGGRVEARSLHMTRLAYFFIGGIGMGGLRRTARPFVAGSTEEHPEFLRRDAVRVRYRRGHA